MNEYKEAGGGILKLDMLLQMRLDILQIGSKRKLY
jgi:hypothetical protein